MFPIYSLNQTIYKRYIKIDQHLAWHFVYNVECLLSPTPYPCSQIIKLVFNLIIYTNQEKELEF